MKGETVSQQQRRQLEALRGRVAELESRCQCLQETIEQLKVKDRAVDGSITAIAIADLEGKLTYVNRSFLTMWGYQDDTEALGQPVASFWQTPEGLSQVFQSSAVHGNWLGEQIAKRKDGSTFPAHLSASGVTDDSGKLICMMASCIDVTAHKRAEEALRDSEATARALLDAAAERAVLRELDGTIVAANEATARGFGTTTDELIGKNTYELVAPELAARRKRFHQRAIREGKPVRFHDQRDGRWLYHNVYPIRDRQGRVTRLAVFAQDVTEQALAEEALRASEQRYRSLFEISPISLWEFDFSKVKEYVDALRREGVGDVRGHLQAHPERIDEVNRLPTIVGVNQAAVEFFGADSKQHLRSKLATTFTECSAALFREWFLVLTEGRTAFEGEATRRTVSGKPIYTMSRWSLDPAHRDTWSRVLLSVVDITHRKAAEDALRERETHLRAIFEAAENVSFITTDLGGTEARILGFSPGAERIFGYKRDEIVGRPLALLHTAKDVAAFAKVTEALARRKTGLSHETTLVRKNGERFPALLSVYPLLDAEGKMDRVLGVSIDITERKRAEEALRRSELLYRTTIDVLDHAIHVVDSDLRITLCNNAFTQWCQELDLPEPRVGDKVFEVFPFLPGKVRDEYRQVFQTGQTLVAEETTCLAGREFITETRKIPVLADGRVVRIITVVRDVTEPRRAEQALRDSEARLRQVIDLVPHPIFAKDKEGRHILMNRAAAAGYGGTVEQLTGRLQSDLHPNAEEVEQYLKEDREVIETGKPKVIPEEPFTNCRGEVRILQTTKVPYTASGTSEPAVLGMSVDITSLKQTEQALRESEQRYRDLFDHAPLCIFEEDSTQTPPVILRVNRRTQETFGYSAEEFASLPVEQLVPPEAMDVAARVGKALLAGQTIVVESINRRRDGSVFPVRLSATASPTAGPKRSIVMIEDITERKRAEQALQDAHRKLMNAAEQERRRLAGELHDSVAQKLVALKLQFQGLASVAKGVDSHPHSAEMNGIAGLCDSLIHEVRRICHGLYPPALESLGLVAGLRQLAGYARREMRVSIRCLGQVQTARFPADVEIALFRIAQEALTNSLRHSKAERVQICLGYRKGQVSLGLADDGIGFDVAKATGRGLGLSTMRERADAVDGEFKITSRPGRTHVKVTAPAEALPHKSQV